MTVLLVLRETAENLGGVIAANPTVAGGATALCVAMTFFTANAVYFQEQQHPSAFFATRPALVAQAPAPRAAAPAPQPSVTRFATSEPAPSADTRPIIPAVAPVPEIRPEREVAANLAAPETDTTVAGIQELLAKLGYYQGTIDGLRGPVTDSAIETYKQKVGLRGIELSEADLMTSLRNNLGVTAAIPEKRSTAEEADVSQLVAELIESAASGDGAVPLPDRIPSADVVKVQAALRAFGNTDIVVDGIAGEQTELAIREFQALFQLPVNGEIDGTLLDKMRTVGLIQ
ncbi:peptidoglycan-binding protein [Oricola sp.]|uniref:peptidoglycan-binding domain-containing protein n=1 Tax=Oricola sp. TaxID=1979950 RepID=UPI0025EA3B64|nr:peptidoglycan-binding protein [Oricola sp.]MCI5073532.1 peptidoglycan-binding protein [Oricola sp.]